MNEADTPKKRRILVVDDDADIRLLFGTYLNNSGHDVEEASDGQQGWEKFRTGDFDVVLLDVMMPGMNGFDLLKKMSKEKPATPVIMLSGRAQMSVRNLGLKEGAVEFIEKPIGASELIARIDAVLRQGS